MYLIFKRGKRELKQKYLCQELLYEHCNNTIDLLIKDWRIFNKVWIWKLSLIKWNDKIKIKIID